MGEQRYRLNSTLAVAHDFVAYRDVGQEREQDAVSFITPCNSGLLRVVMPRQLLHALLYLLHPCSRCPAPLQTHSSTCPTEDSRIKSADGIFEDRRIGC